VLHTLRLTWLAVLLVIALAPHARALHHENRAGIFFSLVAHSRLAVAAQAVETHQQNPIYKEKTAAGIREYRARYYDPGLGRFLSEDPIGFEAGDFNLQRYVTNQPLSYTDPTGLISIYEYRRLNRFAKLSSLKSGSLAISLIATLLLIDVQLAEYLPYKEDCEAAVNAAYSAAALGYVSIYGVAVISLDLYAPGSDLGDVVYKSQALKELAVYTVALGIAQYKAIEIRNKGLAKCSSKPSRP